MYGDFRQLFDDIRKNWKTVARRYQYAKSRFFYNQKFISVLLFNRTHQNLPKTKFIDYNLAFQYYSNDRKQLKISYEGEEKAIELPYAELINFIEQPEVTITVDGPITQYQLPETVAHATQAAFDTFLTDRPNTTNGRMLRLTSFESDGKGKTSYRAKLQAAGYFDEVHTNLSLDYPLADDVFETMRIRDLTTQGDLRPLDQSLLVNTIGAFTAVALYSDGNWFFHMVPRQHQLGVFNGMLSSVSGNVDLPEQPINELVGYVTAEIKREFHEETGLNINELEKSGRATVIPLAFTRELSRGGKPQFFYLTVLHDVTEREFSKAFKTAKTRSEFRSDLFSNITALDDIVSPEFSTALFYALAYIQHRRKFPTDTLILP